MKFNEGERRIMKGSDGECMWKEGEMTCIKGKKWNQRDDGERVGMKRNKGEWRGMKEKEGE